MTARYFCDQCGDEVTDKRTTGNRIKRRRDRVSVEVLVAVDGTWNDGHVCQGCVIRAINKGKDLPR